MGQVLSDYGHIIGSGYTNVQATMLLPNAPEGKILQYIGPTTEQYTNGYFYKKTALGWERLNTQPEQASEIAYDNTASGSTATTIQEAVDSALTSLGGISFSIVSDE